MRDKIPECSERRYCAPLRERVIIRIQLQLPRFLAHFCPSSRYNRVSQCNCRISREMAGGRPVPESADDSITGLLAAGKMSVGTPAQTIPRADAPTARVAGRRKRPARNSYFLRLDGPKIVVLDISGPGRQGRPNGSGTWAFRLSQKRAPS
jgi:hypothetical protein